MMGMYTRMDVDIKLKDCTPDYVRYILEDLIENYGGECEDGLLLDSMPIHPFFLDERFDSIGYCRHATKNEDDSECPSFNFPHLKIRCEVKNYTRVLEKFLDWITPYVDEASGIYHYEEWWNPSEILLKEHEGKKRFMIRHSRDPHGYGSGYGWDYDDEKEPHRIEFITAFIEDTIYE